VNLRLLDAAALAALLDDAALIDALEDAFRQGLRAPPRHHHAVPRPAREPADLLIMPCWDPGRFTGIKLVHVCPGNAELDLPTVQGLFVLFDGPTGTPRAVLDGTELTLRRTAAASALASRFLSREDSTTLAVFGAGALAPHLIRAHAVVRPIRRVLLWNRTRARAEALAKRLRGEERLAEVRVVDRPGDALAQADIVSCATRSREPLVAGAAVRPGTHVDLVGAFRPDMREADPELFARAEVYVDTREGALAEAGDLLAAIATGRLRCEEIRGDLYDLCSGRTPGRSAPDTITVFKSVGSAVEDLTAAVLAMRQVEEGGEPAPAGA